MVEVVAGVVTDPHRGRESVNRPFFITSGAGASAGAPDRKGYWIVKTQRIWLVSALLLALVLPCSTSLALPPGGGGPGGQDPPNDSFELYGDLYVVLRDTNGEAIKDKNGCVRPIFPIEPDSEAPDGVPDGLTCALIPLCGDDPTGLACTEEGLKSTDGEVEYCDLWDPYPYMAPDPDFPDDNPLFAHLQEVHFGRLSSARSPVDVIDHGYLEAISRLNRVQQLEDQYGNTLPNITTDPAGRIHYYALNAETGETGWFTIDAPLENLGLYDRIMKFGTLLRVEYVRVEHDLMYIVEEAAPDWNKYVFSAELASLHPCPYGPGTCVLADYSCDPYDGIDDCDELLDPTRDDLMIAASAIAAAGDKTAFYATDTFIHINTYLGINDLDSETFFPYDQLLFPPYDLFTQFGSKPSVPLLQSYPDGMICADGLNILDGYPCFFVADVQAYYAATFRSIRHCTSFDTDHFYEPVEVDGPAIEEIFEGTLDSKGYDAENLGEAQQFAQAAEDARAIIWYIHNWELPELVAP